MIKNTNKQAKKEVEIDPSFFDYEKYFKQSVSATKTKQPKHKYTVEITRAMYSDEAFKIYQAYQLSIHKDEKESKSQYENFLCQVPLFDPKDQNIPQNAT